jgi:hypothetical protein
MKSPPSQEAFLEVFQVVQKVATSPGETLHGLALFILVEGPDGDLIRSVVSPADAELAMLRLIQPKIAQELEEP